MLDANSLRRQVGQHAEALNRLNAGQNAGSPFRERMGHTRWEIAAGIAVGIGVAAMMVWIGH
jgi:acid phosphatase family membrane protein YuiD